MNCEALMMHAVPCPMPAVVAVGISYRCGCPPEPKKTLCPEHAARAPDCRHCGAPAMGVVIEPVPL